MENNKILHPAKYDILYDSINKLHHERQLSEDTRYFDENHLGIMTISLGWRSSWFLKGARFDVQRR